FPVLNRHIPVGADILGMEDLRHLLRLTAEPEGKFRVGAGGVIVKQFSRPEPVQVKNIISKGEPDLLTRRKQQIPHGAAHIAEIAVPWLDKWSPVEGVDGRVG